MDNLFTINKNPIKLKKRAGILIPNEYVNSPFYSYIRANLTRSFLEYNTSELIINKFFLESDKFLTIPRFFPVQDYIGNYNIEDISNPGQDIKINHNIIPRTETQKKAINYMLKNDSGLIQLQPGVGKTVISIYVVAERKKKTFILTHKDYLAEQWIGPGKQGSRAGFLDFTDLPKEEIVRLTSSNFQNALKRSIIVTTDQTFISLLKRKRKEFLEALHKANIGILIADEVHTSVGAPTFSECSIHIPAKVVFGLSATPYRYDGNGDIIKYHMGPLFSEDDSSGTMDARVSIFLFDFEIVNGTIIRKKKIVKINRTKYLWWEGKFQRARYLNLFKNSIPLINLSKSLINKFKDNKDILFIAERIENFLLPMFNWTPSEDKGLFISGSKDEDLQKNIVYSTPGKIRDGVNVPNKNLLILTSPISNIAQITGRVTRTKEGKETPIVIDMVDTGCKDIYKTLFQRLDYYDLKKWPVQFIIIRNGKTEVIDRKEAFKILNDKNDNQLSLEIK